MKIARVNHDGSPRVGILDGEQIRLLEAGTDVVDLLVPDPGERDEIVSARSTGDSVAASGVKLLAPLEPTSLRDFVTFEEHMEGMVKQVGVDIPSEWFEAPTFYFTNVAAVTGPYDDVRIAPGETAQDFELEVAVIVGKDGSDLTVEEAHEHIAGYTILNDWSARTLQMREMKIGLGPCKGKDSANTLGPWIVTADELAEHEKDGRLHLELSVQRNGEHFGDDTLANMGWSFAEMIAYASRGTTVRAGDVLGSGTCGGGCLAELWSRGVSKDELPPLAPGDEITITVEGIGTISNKLVAGVGTAPIPAQRPSAFRRERSYD
jgi:2-keto-4-pentenoate hydratase/2-oxohepta-3-ene-1,7-dioic acid hydratase in catechol pathway